jgi:hypothetical protein
MGDSPVTKTLGRMIAVAAAASLALGVPGAAFADMGYTGWDLLEIRSVRSAAFGVVILAAAIAAVGVVGLWRMAVRSAALEITGSEGEAR